MKQAYLTTTQIAKIFGINSDTIRRGLCVNGHYLGIKPIKMPNRRLMWPMAGVTALLPEQAQKEV